MKKSLLGLILLIFLTGCQASNKVTTYSEVIKDGRVEIDGIVYDIKRESKTEFTYDNKKNLIEKTNIHDGNKMRTYSIYEDNQLIEDRFYSNEQLLSTNYYYYENDKLIKNKHVSAGGLEVRTEYFYGDHTKKQISYNSDGKVGYISTAYMDDDDKIIKIINTEADGEISQSITLHYQGDLLAKAISKSRGMKIKASTYEYNNLGDKVMEYMIFYGETNTLFVGFYDYEYDENSLIKTMILNQVQAQIEDKDIRSIEE